MKQVSLYVALSLSILFCFLGLLSIVDERINLRTPPRFVLLYSTCTLNKEYLQPYNDTIRFTPNFKRFASDSIVFLKHQTEAPFSGGAYASLFTGTHAYRHRIFYHPARLDSKNYLMSEAFRDNGYNNYLWTIQGLASPELNYAQGFQPQNIYRKAPPWNPNTLNKEDRNFINIVQEIRNNSDRKAYAQVVYSATHAPYTGMSNLKETLSFCDDYPEECSGVSSDELKKYFSLYAEHQKAISFHFDETVALLKLNHDDIAMLAKVVEIVYKSCVRELDRYFGNTLDVLEEAGLINETLIVFTADHGELLYRENAPIHWFHGHLEPEILEIPFMIRLPDKKFAGLQYPAVTRSIDVFPTVATLAGLDLKRQKLDGVDLSSSFETDNFRELIAFSYGESGHPAVMQDDPKSLECMARMGDVYFRLSSIQDGSEVTLFQSNKNGGQPSSFNPANRHHAMVKNGLIQYRKRLISAYPKEDENPTNHEEVREKLRSLGYLN